MTDAAQPSSGGDLAGGWLANWPTQSKMALVFAAMMLVVLAGSALVLLSQQRTVDARHWVQHTDKVLQELNKVRAGAINQQAGLRGFIISTEERFLEPYDAGRVAYLEAIAAIREMTGDNPYQQVRVSDLEGQMRDWHTRVATPLISAVRSSEYTGEKSSRLAIQVGKEHLDRVRLIIADMEAQERNLQAQREAVAVRYEKVTQRLAYGLIICGILIGLLSLKMTRRLISHPLMQISGLMTRLAQHDNSIEVIRSSRRDEIGALERALAVFKDMATDIQGQNWVKTQVAGVFLKIQSCSDLQELGDIICSEVTPILGGNLAVLFRVDAEQNLLFWSGYGYGQDHGEGPSKTLAPELLRQCARDQRLITVDGLAAGDLHIRSALINAVPGCVVLLPIVRGGKTLAALEVGLLQPLSDLARRFLEEITPIIALSMENLGRAKRTATLLDESREQARRLAESENSLRAQQQELQVSNNRLEQSSRYKGEFLANMSHEIRTPMNAVLGMLQLLERTSLDRRQADYVSKTQIAARGLLDIINDILDFSKIESGKLTLDPQPFLVDQLLRDVAVILGASLGEKNLELLFRVDPDLQQCLVGDSSRLKQVLLNLAANAIKFTEEGEVMIAVDSPGTTDDDRVRVRFSIRDSGIGISPEQQKLLFQAFSQAEAGISRRYGGTGLGLTISQNLVRLMGGDIQLQSAVGEGSTFFFEIALAMASSEAQVEVRRRRAARADLKNLHILVVDDHEAARQIMAEHARSLGWRADAVGSGADAIQKVALSIEKGSGYDVAFIDWRMPEMDGFDTIVKLREMAAAEELPLLMMVSAHGRDTLTEQIEHHAVGVDGFLIKPITASDLFDTVASSLQSDVVQGAPPALQERADRRLSGLRVLLAEDNATNQQIAEELLTSAGASVTLANNGEEAVAAVEAATRPFDAVLMDMQMPVMDGMTATRKIREKLGATDLPIIAMTANTMASDRDACLAAGMNDHVGKPFDFDDIVHALLSHCKQPQEVTPSVAEQEPISDADYDFAAALKRLNGDTRMYGRLLRAFPDAHGDDLRQAIDLFNKGDREAAIHVLHTLRGVALTLGANGLSEGLLAIETSAKDGVGIPALAEMVDRAKPQLVHAMGALVGQAKQLDPASNGAIG